jgi:hypothetical protein
VSLVPEVDPGDDTVRRWVLHHYQFDPVRGQRRSIVVAAYDNEAEFAAALETYSWRIRSEIESGARDHAEHASGVVWPPGHHATQAGGRIARQAARHGVDPPTVSLGGPLPSNKVFLGWDSNGNTSSLGGGEQPQPPDT